jgi:hypothetical protein
MQGHHDTANKVEFNHSARTGGNFTTNFISDVFADDILELSASFRGDANSNWWSEMTGIGTGDI